jgi:hypothetical protein
MTVGQELRRDEKGGTTVTALLRLDLHGPCE